MEWSGDRQDYRAFCAELGGDFDGAFYGTGMAGDYGLIRRIKVGGGADFAIGGALAGIGHYRGRQAHDGGHCSYACGDGFLAVGAALPDQLHGIGELQCAGSYEGGVFAEAVAGYKIGSEASFREDAIDGHGTGEEGGLRVGGELQIVFGAFTADFGDGETEGFVRLVENRAGYRIFIRQFLAHARVL